MPTFAASKPSATQITSIKAIEKGFKVKWKKKSCTGYQVQYSTSKKFTSKTSKTLKVNKAKTTSKTVNKLKAKKKYYVRVRTYKTVKKKNYYSKWSANYSVTTKAKKTSSSNSNTTTSSSATPQIKSVERVKGTTNFNVSYSTVKGAVDYEVQVATTSSFKKQYSDNPNSSYPTGSGTTLSVHCSAGDRFYEDLFDDSLSSSKSEVKYPTRYFRVRARFLDKNYNETYSKWSNVYKYTGPITDEQYEFISKMNSYYSQMNINSSDGDFDKLVKIQRWIDSHWTYSQGGYSLYIDGKGACDDFAEHFNYFTHKAGLKSYYVSGGRRVGEGHAWNLIKIDGYWYSYDCESYGPEISNHAHFYSKTSLRQFILNSDSQNLYNNCSPMADDNLMNDIDYKLDLTLYNGR